jgi:hypothetical protein
LQLTSSDLLLVHRLGHSVGSTEPHWNLLASSPWVASGHVPFRHGCRLSCQLAQKSHFSLCYHRPIVSDRGRHVSALRHAPDFTSRHQLALASHSHRRRGRVSAGMAVWEAPRVLIARPFSQECLERNPCKSRNSFLCYKRSSSYGMEMTMSVAPAKRCTRWIAVGPCALTLASSSA